MKNIHQITIKIIDHINKAETILSFRFSYCFFKFIHKIHCNPDLISQFALF